MPQSPDVCSAALGFDEKRGLWNRIRVDEKGCVILSQESIDAIAKRFIELAWENANPISPLPKPGVEY